MSSPVSRLERSTGEKVEVGLVCGDGLNGLESGRHRCPFWLQDRARRLAPSWNRVYRIFYFIQLKLWRLHTGISTWTKTVKVFLCCWYGACGVGISSHYHLIPGFATVFLITRGAVPFSICSSKDPKSVCCHHTQKQVCHRVWCLQDWPCCFLFFSLHSPRGSHWSVEPTEDAGPPESNRINGFLEVVMFRSWGFFPLFHFLPQSQPFFNALNVQLQSGVQFRGKNKPQGYVDILIKLYLIVPYQ